jgi:hypothetical protein
MIHLFLKMAWKVDEAANFFVQLIEKESGIYDKGNPDYVRLGIEFAWDEGVWVQV